MIEMLKARKEALESRGAKGFTLMEMLIVIAIIAVLVAIAIPVLGAQLAKAQATTDEANIRDGYASYQVAQLQDNDFDKDATYYLQKDGSVTKGTGANDYQCKGASADLGADVDVAGNTFTWTKDAKITYKLTDGKVVIAAA